jgi:GTP pyrophosphokinase
MCVNVSVVNGPGEEARLIEVKWYTASNVAYKADITVMANDRTQLLMEVTNTIGEAKIPLKAMKRQDDPRPDRPDQPDIGDNGTEQLEKIIKKLRKVDGVFEVTRSKDRCVT